MGVLGVLPDRAGFRFFVQLKYKISFGNFVHVFFKLKLYDQGSSFWYEPFPDLDKEKYYEFKDKIEKLWEKQADSLQQKK